MLEGKNVRLRVMEGDDLKIAAEWSNDPCFFGEYNTLEQVSQTEFERRFENFTADKGAFVIEKRDGTKVGFAGYYTSSEKLLEIGFALVRNERGKGYCTEAAEIIVDYLFLSKDVVRVQAHTETRNTASQRVLEKAGFKKEGTVRKSYFVRGEWRDTFLYSILRAEWGRPKILTK
jgi:ribosomal-protein-alanine N-acetyltransferase